MNRIINIRKGSLTGDELNEITSILSSGGVIVSPTDTVYGLISWAFSKRAYERINYLKRNHKLPYVVCFSDLGQFEEYFNEIDPLRMRLLNTVFPGPFTVVLNSNSHVQSGFGYEHDGIGVRLASDTITESICTKVEHPIWATSANRAGESTPVSYEQVDAEIIKECDLSVNGGKTRFGEASTVIDTRSFPFKISRNGPLVEIAERALERTLTGLRVLVVCTGNICRSPFACGLLQHMLGNPEKSGVEVTSAGTHARTGDIASKPMLQIAGEKGFSIEDHRSRPLDYEMIEDADLILVNEQMHSDIIIENNAAAAGKTHLIGELAGFGEVPDPYNSDLEFYRKSASIIENSLIGWKEYLERMIEISGWRQISNHAGSHTL